MFQKLSDLNIWCLYLCGHNGEECFGVLLTFVSAFLDFYGRSYAKHFLIGFKIEKLWFGEKHVLEAFDVKPCNDFYFNIEFLLAG